MKHKGQKKAMKILLQDHQFRLFLSKNCQQYAMLDHDWMTHGVCCPCNTEKVLQVAQVHLYDVVDFVLNNQKALSVTFFHLWVSDNIFHSFITRR